MGETVEKIYCCDRGDSDNALAAAILANKGNDNNLLPFAMMNGAGGMNGWMNNPFAYIMFLALFRNGGFGFGGDGAPTQGIETQAQLNAIRTQLQDNQNADCIKSAIQGNGFAISQLAQNLNVDFNALQKSCCDVQAAIQQVGGQIGLSAERVINAVNMGDCGVIQALQNCCCQTQQNITRMGYETQLGQKDIQYTTQRGFDYTNTGLERGFSNVAYETQRQTCNIINNANANTQRVIDTLNSHWSDEKALQIQDLKFQLSQERQNNLINERFNRLGNGYNGGCGCGCGCGCGQ